MMSAFIIEALLLTQGIYTHTPRDNAPLRRLYQ